jgi:hypothetical protein
MPSPKKMKIGFEHASTAMQTAAIFQIHVGKASRFFTLQAHQALRGAVEFDERKNRLLDEGCRCSG